jgi:hypothetical protein
MQIDIEQDIKYHPPSKLSRRKKLISDVIWCFSFLLVSFLSIGVIFSMAYYLATDRPYLEKKIADLTQRDSVRKYKDWNDYMTSTRDCRETTEEELSRGDFRLYSEGGKVFYVNLHDLMEVQKKILPKARDVTNFVVSNAVLEGINASCPCTCTFLGGSGGVLSMLDPRIFYTSKEKASVEETVPFLISEEGQTREKIIHASLDLEYYSEESRRKETIRIMGEDVNTVYNCLNFQRKRK